MRTPERFARLPQWAQHEIDRLERDLAYARSLLDIHNDEDTNVWLGSISDTVNLPKDSRVTFLLENDEITVQHDSHHGLRIMSRRGALLVRPSGGVNVLNVKSEGKF